MATELARSLVDAVADRGADTVFGLPGGGPNLDVVGAATDAGLRFVLMHGESAACIAGATYGLLTGRPALALATRGPGVSSAANGVAQATLDRYPLLLVTDVVPERDAPRVAHQRFDQRALLAPVTKWSGTLGRDEPAGTAAGALDLAATVPYGAVHLDFDPTASGERPPPPPLPAGRDDDAVRMATGLVRAAGQPVVIVGAGALPWAAQVRAALTGRGWPVLTTYQAAGVIDSEHADAGGLFTGGASETALLREADLVLTVGLDHVEPIPGPWDHAMPVVSIDAVPPTDRYLLATVAVTGPVGPLLEEVVAGATPRRGWPAGAGAAHREAVRAALRQAPATGLGPLAVVAAVAASAPPGTLATVDAGAHFLAVMPMWPAAEPLTLLISNGLATMGFALPAAIGLALARPDRPVTCFVGDGGLGMTLAELETIARLRLPVTVVVFDDAALSLIEVKQQPWHGGEAAVRYWPVDFAAVARACGLEATTADDEQSLRRALGAGWDRPRLIDARIDPSGYRHLIAVTRG